MRTYLSSTGRSGYGIDRECHLISLFSLPGAFEGATAVKDAIANGATELDCIGNILADFYKTYGFAEYHREKWDDRFAPKGWNYDKWGRPDIIFMRRLE